MGCAVDWLLDVWPVNQELRHVVRHVQEDDLGGTSVFLKLNAGVQLTVE